MKTIHIINLILFTFNALWLAYVPKESMSRYSAVAGWAVAFLLQLVIIGLSK